MKIISNEASDCTGRRDTGPTFALAEKVARKQRRSRITTCMCPGRYRNFRRCERFGKTRRLCFRKVAQPIIQKDRDRLIAPECGDDDIGEVVTVDVSGPKLETSYRRRETNRLKRSSR